MMVDGKGVRVTYQEFLRGLRNDLKAVGVEVHDGKKWRYGTHSMRRGGAQMLARCGLESAAVKAYGRWGSDVVEIYVREAPLYRSAYISKMVVSPLARETVESYAGGPSRLEMLQEQTSLLEKMAKHAQTEADDAVARWRRVCAEKPVARKTRKESLVAMYEEVKKAGRRERKEEKKRSKRVAKAVAKVQRRFAREVAKVGAGRAPVSGRLDPPPAFIFSRVEAVVSGGVTFPAVVRSRGVW
jgi:hypothetical protein